MADKCDDASAALNLPDLDFLISAAGRQIVFDSAHCCVILLGGDFAHIFGLFFRLFLCSCRLPFTLFLRLSPVLQCQLHLLDSFLSSEPGGDGSAGFILAPGAIFGVTALRGC